MLEDLASAGWSVVKSARFVARRMAAEPRARVALCNTVVTGELAEVLASHGIDVLSYVHELPTSVAMYSAEAAVDLIRRSSRRIIAVSRSVRDELVETYGVPAGDVEVIYTGLRPDTGSEVSRRSLFERYKLPDADRLIVGCGMVHPRKGPDIFVQAAQALHSEGVGDTLFVWIGGEQGGDDARRWAQHDARRLGLADRLFFLGQVPEARSFIKEADVLLLTSREDPYPLVVLEAIEFGYAGRVFRQGRGSAGIDPPRRGSGCSLSRCACDGRGGAGFPDQRIQARGGEGGSGGATPGITWDRYIDQIPTDSLAGNEPGIGPTRRRAPTKDR